MIPTTTPTIVCPRCDGRGTAWEDVPVAAGFTRVEIQCGTCRGRGYLAFTRRPPRPRPVTGTG